jgi:hypothetical protein
MLFAPIASLNCYQISREKHETDRQNSRQPGKLAEEPMDAGSPTL